MITPANRPNAIQAIADIDGMMDRTYYEPVISKAAKATMVSNSVSLSISRSAKTRKICDC